MSDSESVPKPLPAPSAERGEGLPAPNLAANPQRWLFLVGLIAAGALVLSALLWQKLGNIQEELARRSTESTAQSIEARTLARQAQEATRDITARLALL
ncbi:MAG: hypothetical protein H7238_04505, partial [Polaromonas sp.]|nr:hypothetical protein [Polaromonas sp.]